MKEIYQLAEIVLAWLGDKDDDIFRAFDTFELLFPILPRRDEMVDDETCVEWLRREPRLCVNNRNDDEYQSLDRNSFWISLHKFSGLQYWYRVWIFQEAVLARDLFLICASRILDSSTVLHVAVELETLKNRISSKAVQQPSFLSDSAWAAVSIGYADLARLRRIAEARSTEDRNSSSYSINISQAAAQLEATDAKDYVYALLGVTYLPIEPDYTGRISVIDVFCTYVSVCIDMYWRDGKCEFDELWFLSYGGRGSGTMPGGFPTWLPGYQFVPPHVFLRGCADATLFTSEERASRADIVHRTLNTLGARVATVSRVENISHDEDKVVRSKLLLYLTDFVSRNQSGIQNMTPQCALARVLDMANVTNPALSPGCSLGLLTLVYATVLEERQQVEEEDRFVAACAAAAATALGWSPNTSFTDWVVAAFGIAEDSLGVLPEVDKTKPETTMPLIWGQFLSETRTMALFINVMARDCTLVEAGGKYIGIAPLSTLEGDIICVLKGCSVPVILRRCDAGNQYRFVGQCWMLGLMEGQAAGLREKGLISPETFELV